MAGNCAGDMIQRKRQPRERSVERMGALLANFTAGFFPLAAAVLSDEEPACVTEAEDASTRARTLVELIEHQVSRTPDRIAARFEGRSITCGDLDRRAGRIAGNLAARGAGPGVLVGLLVSRSLDMLAALLGILKTGAAYLPLDPAYPRKRIAFILRDSEAPLVLLEKDRPGVVPREATGITLEEALLPGSGAGRVRSRAAGADDIAYVIYTSGSTGVPKGVRIPNRAVVNFLRSMMKRPGITADDVVAAVTTVSFDIAVLELFLPLAAGARLVIAGDDEARDGRRLIRLLAHEGVTIFQATPVTWRLMLEGGWEGSPRLTALCGGEAMSRELAEALLDRSAALWNMYGPTETTVWSTVCLVAHGEGPVPLGEPIDNTSIHVLDPAGRPVEPGDIGEIYIGGEGVALGYLNRPELEAERFIEDPFSGKPGARMYRTGDLASRLADGTLLFHGRADHQLKVRGFRIEPGEIESALRRRPGVREAIVAGVKDRHGDTNLVAYIVAGGNGTLDLGSIRLDLAETLPGYMVPQHYVLVDRFPLTPNGKIDRAKLPAPGADPDLEAVPAQDEVEKKLTAIWEEVLGLRGLGSNADFFRLGGRSLQAARLFAGIRREFGQDHPVSLLIDAPTISLLAGHLRQGEAHDAWRALVPIRASGSRRPLFVVHGGGDTVLFARDLAEELGDDRPVYGLQSEGLDGRRVTAGSVEEMAGRYLDEVRRVQPHGPYLLAGYCFGGAVAVEMARRLEQVGETVAFVGLVNAPNPAVAPGLVEAAGSPGAAAGSPLPWWLPGRGGLEVFRSAVADLSFSARATHLARAVRHAIEWRRDAFLSRRWKYGFQVLAGRLLLVAGARVPKPWRSAYVQAMTKRAERRYRPSPYRGRITVIRGAGLYRDPALGWADVARVVETCELGEPQRFRRELIAPPLAAMLGSELRQKLESAEAAS